MTPLSPPRTRRWSSLPAAFAAAALIAALPSAAQAADGLALVDETEQIAPGVELRHLKTLEAAGLVRPPDPHRQARRERHLQRSHHGRRADRALADRAGAVAAINGDFFDINSSGAPHAGAIKGGQLLKSEDLERQATYVGVTRDGVGRLFDLAIEATATLNGQPREVVSVNTGNLAGTPADGMVAFTPIWGRSSRQRPFDGNPADLAEVLVQDDRVVAVDPDSAGAGEIPQNGFYLVGRGAAAEAIRALQPGDPVTLAWGLTDELARQAQFAVGGGQVLISDGAIRPGLAQTRNPQTVLGFKDGGRTMLLVTSDGRQSPILGPTNQQVAELLHELGAETALALDGGGSTTMVARGLGDERVSVRNSPSDGAERHNANGVGIFSASGSGQVDRLVVSPDDDEARIFPGMTRTFRVKAVDDRLSPVSIARGDVRWTTNAGTIAGGVLHASEQVFGHVRVRATTDTAQEEVAVRVLGELTQLELSESRLSFSEAGAAQATRVRVTGRDAEGFAAPVEAADLELDYDDSIVKVSPDGDRLRITPLAAGGTVLTVSADGDSVQLPISVGVQTHAIDYFTARSPIADRLWRWAGSGGSRTLTDTPEGVRIDYSAQRNIGITSEGRANTVPLPGAPLRIRVRMKATVPVGLTFIALLQGDGTYRSLYGKALQPGWNDVEVTLPADTKYPIALDTVQAIETNTALQRDGSVTFGEVEVDVPSEVELPDPEPLVEEALISPDGALQEGADFTFATLSDVQFTHVNQEMVPVAIQALRRIRATRPDLVVLNGDIVDLGARADMDLARTTLEAGGCELVELGSEALPEPTDSTVPCLYVPGNHESYAPTARCAAPTGSSFRCCRRRWPRRPPATRSTT